MAWISYSSPVTPSPAHSRIEFIERSTPTPLHVLIEMMDVQLREKRLMVAVGRARRLAAQSHQDELGAILGRAGGVAAGNDVRKTVGDVATGLLVGSANTAALIVLQAAEETNT
jgi:hypothetical protein